MMRVSAFQAVGGFSETIIAGEEPELCLRLRNAGYEIHRIDAEMTIHDAALTQFRQWWKRNARTGHAATELVARYGSDAGPAAMRRITSILVWSLGPPALALASIPLFGAASMAVLGVYAWLAFKIYRHERERGRSSNHASLYAGACILGKFAELEGIGRFARNRLLGRGPNRLIEYKGAES